MEPDLFEVKAKDRGGIVLKVIYMRWSDGHHWSVDLEGCPDCLSVQRKYSEVQNDLQKFGHSQTGSPLWEGDVGWYLPPNIIGLCNLPNSWDIWVPNDPGARHAPRCLQTIQDKQLLCDVPEPILQVAHDLYLCDLFARLRFCRCGRKACVHLCLAMGITGRQLCLTESLSKGCF